MPKSSQHVTRFHEKGLFKSKEATRVLHSVNVSFKRNLSNLFAIAPVIVPFKLTLITCSVINAFQASCSADPTYLLYFMSYFVSVFLILSLFY